MRRSGFRTALTAALIVAALTPSAYAQQGATASPLTVERIDNRFVVAPDFKATDVDNELGQLAGINVGAGYRAVALTDALRDRVDGATGSIAVEFDW
jgi:hypothetical protein